MGAGTGGLKCELGSRVGKNQKGELAYFLERWALFLRR